MSEFLFIFITLSVENSSPNVRFWLSPTQFGLAKASNVTSRVAYNMS